MTKYLLISSLLLCVACGDDGDGAAPPDAGASVDAAIVVDPDAAVPLTIDDVCDQNEGMFVDFFEAALECFPQFELFLGSLPSDAELSAACYGQFGEFVIDGTVALGTLDDLAACAAVISGIDCQTFEFDTPNECTNIVSGTLAMGADCDSAEQCAGDSYCDKSADAACGICAARKADLQACFDNQECTGRRCSGALGVQAGVCRSFGLVGADCSDDEDCAGQLECNTISATCGVPQVWAAGDTCASNENGDCGFPLSNTICDEGNTICVEYLTLGNACSGPFQCKFLKYESCDLGNTNTCVAPTIRGLNENCSFFTGDKCAVGLRCSNPGDGGLCLQPPQVGDSCTPGGNECGDFLLNCVNGECQHGEYSGMCPAP